MRIYEEINLPNFSFWSGAKDNASKFTTEEMEQIESMLEDYYGETGVSATEINDFFWFEPETLCEWLGIDEEEFWNRK